MEILVKIEGEENITVKIDADEWFGLVHDEFDEEFVDGNRRGGTIRYLELTINSSTAHELAETLQRELTAEKV